MIPSAHHRPLRVEGATLIVRDLASVRAFYERVLGLSLIASEPGHATLGAGETPFLTLIEDKAASPDDKREAGLYHLAYLTPTRADLGAWLDHAVRIGAPLTGASDHAVSEAIYLDDPEGNGVEIYVDRPDEEWPRGPDGAVAMTTDPLDVHGLMAARSEWRGFPEDGRIGHAHLRVGDVDQAESFYADRLGLAVTSRWRHALFVGSGGYHHHIAANLWSSAGAGPRPAQAAGLRELRLSADPTAFAAIGALEAPATLHDPWGLDVVLERRADA